MDDNNGASERRVTGNKTLNIVFNVVAAIVTGIGLCAVYNNPLDYTGWGTTTIGGMIYSRDYFYSSAYEIYDKWLS